MTVGTEGGSAGEDAVGFLDELAACLSSRVNLQALVLFGSRATEDAFDESDWDLAVISEGFEGLDPLARGLLTVDCRKGLIDLVHLTPDELCEPRGSYLRCAILEEGRPVLDDGIFAQAQERYARQKASGEIVFEGALVEFR